MWLKAYAVEVGESGMVYQFISRGVNGSLAKLVVYTKMDTPGIYNLALGDYDYFTGGIDVDCTSNNGDTESVLATVAHTVLAFTDLHPDAAIFARGSTPARTRLYQMGLCKHLEAITQEFRLFGMIDDRWEEFQPNRRYEAFLAERKPKDKGK